MALAYSQTMDCQFDFNLLGQQKTTAEYDLPSLEPTSYGRAILLPQPQTNPSARRYVLPSSPAPLPQLPQRGPSRWIPCAPPPGYSPHSPHPQREPSIWKPCAPPPGYSAHSPHPIRGPSIWQPCAPPPGYSPNSPYSIGHQPSTRPRALTRPQGVARTPFHNPVMSSRLGLPQGKQSGVDARVPPRSVPSGYAGGNTFVDPSLLTSSRPRPTQPTEEKPKPRSSSLSTTTYASKPRQGSIHLEDLCTSDDDSDVSECDLSRSASQPKQRSSRSTKRRKIGSEYYDDTRSDCSGSQSTGLRRSTRSRKQTISYAEA